MSSDDGILTPLDLTALMNKARNESRIPRIRGLAGSSAENLAAEARRYGVDTDGKTHSEVIIAIADADYPPLEEVITNESDATA